MATSTPPTKPPQKTTYAAAHFALELDGAEEVGMFRSIEGGGIKAEVLTYQHGNSHERWHQLGKPKFEDIKLQVGMAMSHPFYQWIKDFIDKKPARKSGAIIAADFHYKERARREFKEALIREIVFPKLDGSDKSAAYMTIGLAVEEIVFKPGEGKELKTGNYNSQKLWTSCNFRFKLDGFESACARVSKVDSFTLKQEIAEYNHGDKFRGTVKCPTRVEFPQISFYVPEADADPFFVHFTKRGINGEVPGRLNGELQTYDSEGHNLFTLSFTGADIANVQPDKSDASSEDVKQVKIDLYTEAMTFEYLAQEVE